MISFFAPVSFPPLFPVSLFSFALYLYYFEGGTALFLEVSGPALPPSRPPPLDSISHGRCRRSDIIPQSHICSRAKHQ